MCSITLLKPIQLLQLFNFFRFILDCNNKNKNCCWRSGLLDCNLMSRGSSTSVLTLNVGKRQKRSVESDSQVHSLLQFRFLISFEGNTSKSLPFVVCDALFVFWRGPIKKGQRGYRVFLGIRRPPSFCLRQWEPCVYFWETSTSFLCLFFKWRVHSYPFTGPGSCPGISRKRLLLPILLVLRGW